MFRAAVDGSLDIHEDVVLLFQVDDLAAFLLIRYSATRA